MWSLLRRGADVDGRRRAIAGHNAGNLFVKRGLAMAACRFVMSVDAKPAIVSIHHDGSVHVTSAGHEMGQVRKSSFLFLFLSFRFLSSFFCSRTSTTSTSYY